MIKQLQYPKFLYWLIPVSLYIIFFEFLLPLNKILPGPSLVYESLSALFKIYGLLFNLFYTASGIYVSMIAAYLIVRFTSGKIISFFHRNQETIKAFSALKYFPLFGIMVIFIFWFPVSNIAEYIFSISFSVLFIVRILSVNLNSVRKEYINSARSLGMKLPEVYSNIYWKSLQPLVFENLEELHNSLWTVMVIYEFIKGDLGIGFIYKLALEYNDISVIFTLSVILMLVLFIGKTVIKYLNKKIIYWEN